MINHSNLIELNEHELMETDGGAVWVPVLIGGGVAIVADEVVRRSTGKTIVQHVGTGLKKVGNWLSK